MLSDYLLKMYAYPHKIVMRSALIREVSFLQRAQAELAGGAFKGKDHKFSTFLGITEVAVVKHGRIPTFNKYMALCHQDISV